MALYLMAASSVTKYHAYVSSAVSAALRMGLHEQVSGFSEQEQTLRHKIWVSVHAMDVYASSTLGLPSSFSPGDLQTQREYEQDDEILPDADDDMMRLASVDSATTAFQQLARVLHSCLDRVYHDRDSKAASVRTQVVSSKSLREASEELRAWGQNCNFVSAQLVSLGLTSTEERLDQDHSTTPRQLTCCTRTQLLLCYAYCQAQLLLYTPLVHHLVQMDSDQTSEGYLYGTKCVRAALAAVHIAEELKRRFQLNEGYFQTVDVLVNASLVLLTVELGSPDAKLLRAAIPAGRRAKEILLALAPLSFKAEECWKAIAVSVEVRNYGSKANCEIRSPYTSRGKASLPSRRR